MQNMLRQSRREPGIPGMSGKLPTRLWPPAGVLACPDPGGSRRGVFPDRRRGLCLASDTDVAEAGRTPTPTPTAASDTYTDGGFTLLRLHGLFVFTAMTCMKSIINVKNKYIVATFYPFSQFCEIGISSLSLQKQPKTAPNLFQRGVEYATYVNQDDALHPMRCLRWQRQERTPSEKGEVLPRGCSLYGLFFTSVEALLVKFPSAQWQLVF